jgi:hypothetical protein
MGGEKGRTRRGDTDAFGSPVNATTAAPDDTRAAHLAEVDLRLEAVEAGLARVAIGMEPTDNLSTYVRLVQIARLHLKAA